MERVAEPTRLLTLKTFDDLVHSKLAPSERLQALKYWVLQADLDSPSVTRPSVSPKTPTGPLKPKLVAKPPPPRPWGAGAGRSSVTAPLKPSSSKPSLTIGATCSLRGKVWKVLLGITKIDAEEYIRLVQHGPSARHDLILTDLKRTFKSDASFQSRVSQDKLIRVLNAFDHWCRFKCISNETFPVKEYCQGIDLLAGVLLYVLPELDAFTALQRVCLMFPLHFGHASSGAHILSNLVDAVLHAHDPQLHHHLVAAMSSSSLSGGLDSSAGDGDVTSRPPPVYAILFAFPRMFSAYACVPPIQHALKTWDFMFARGPYVLPLLACADIEMHREELLAESRNPVAVLERLKSRPVDVETLIAKTMELEATLAPELLSTVQNNPAINTPIVTFAESVSPAAASKPTKHTSIGVVQPRPVVKRVAPPKPPQRASSHVLLR